MSEFGPLISTEWLADHLETEDVKIIDASWRMPGAGDAHKDYLKRQIPGAVFFDIDAVADRRSSLPHMLSSPAQFEKAAGAMGISNKDRIVIYDDQGLFSAARAWWNFRTMGHAEVAVLNGGLPKWLSEGRSLNEGFAQPVGAQYFATLNKKLVASNEDVRAMIAGDETNIVDARPAARFSGETPEPRAGLRSGHMPGAVNLPFGKLIDENGCLASPENLKTLFKDHNARLEAPIMTTCGSGVTAAILYLALHVIGHRDVSLYDGSWAEWGDEAHEPQDFPVVTEN